MLLWDVIVMLAIVAYGWLKTEPDCKGAMCCALVLSTLSTYIKSYGFGFMSPLADLLNDKRDLAIGRVNLHLVADLFAQ